MFLKLDIRYYSNSSDNTVAAIQQKTVIVQEVLVNIPHLYIML